MLRLSSVPAAALLLFAMTEFSDAQLIVAHRGASHAAPENTLAAFGLAWREGADAIEGDFRLTKDGRIVCIHDESTKRTAGVDLKVAESTWEQLQRLDVGAWKGRRWAGERIPSLEQVLASVPKGKLAFLELKSGPEIAEPLAKVLAESDIGKDQVVIMAFDWGVVKAVRAALPEIKTNWLVAYQRNEQSGEWKPDVHYIIRGLEAAGATGLGSQAERAVVNAEFSEEFRRHDFELHVWTVNSPSAALAFRDLGVDSITTDRPAYLRRALGNRRPGK